MEGGLIKGKRDKKIEEWAGLPKSGKPHF